MKKLKEQICAEERVSVVIKKSVSEIGKAKEKFN